MKFRVRFAAQLVGLFVVLALAGAATLIIVTGQQKRWFARTYTYTSSFSTAEGINVGLGITFRGFRIGQVTQVTLSDDNLVDVEFVIGEDFVDRVYENSALQLITNPLGLGGGIIFHQGSVPTPPLPERSYIPPITSTAGRQLVDAGLVRIDQSQDPINAVLQEIVPLVENINDTVVAAKNLLEATTTSVELVNATIRGEQPGIVPDVLSEITGIADAVTLQIGDLIGDLRTLVDGVDVILAQVTDDLMVQVGEVVTIADAQITDLRRQLNGQLTDAQALVERVVSLLLSEAGVLADRTFETVDDSLAQVLVRFDQTTRALFDEVNGLSASLLSRADVISAALLEDVDAVTAEAASVADDVLDLVSTLERDLMATLADITARADALAVRVLDEAAGVADAALAQVDATTGRVIDEAVVISDALQADIDAVLAEVAGLNDEVAGVFDGIDGIFAGVSGGIDGVFNGIDGVFGNVDGLFVGIDGVFQDVDGLFGDVAGLFDDVDDLFDDVLARVDRVVTDAEVVTERLLGQVDSALAEVSALGDDVGTLLATAGGSIDAVTDQVNRTIGDLNTTVDATVARVVDESVRIVDEIVALADGLDTILGDVRGVVASVQTTADDVQDTVREAGDDVTQTTAALSDPTGLVTTLLDPQGSIARLLDDDDELYGQINTILTSVAESVAELRAFAAFLTGTTPQLTGILEEGKDALDTGQEVLEGLRNNPLLRGGITQEDENQPVSDSVRDDEF